MTKPTMMQAEQAAELLGIDVYTLAIQLRYAAADALVSVAQEIRRDEDAPLNVADARRLKAAADAAMAAWTSVKEAEGHVDFERLAEYDATRPDAP